MKFELEIVKFDAVDVITTSAKCQTPGQLVECELDGL